MSRGISLHIGLNSVDPGYYEGWDGTLVACENDAHSMKNIASNLGYEARNLITKKATRSAVTDAISEAANKLSAGPLLPVARTRRSGS